MQLFTVTSTSVPSLLACVIFLFTNLAFTAYQQLDINEGVDGQLLDNSDIVFGSNSKFTLRGSPSALGVVVLDYGANVEGLPTFQVVSASGDTSRLEITYGETKAVLDSSYMSDGPLGLAAAMDTYRVNKYNITEPALFTNKLIQGGFRYQKLNLSTTGELVLANVGVKPTPSITPINMLPGTFECSDADINSIWRTGARTIQLNELPANSIPKFWQVSSEGSYVESQAPQVLFTPTAAALTQYELNFNVKPISNGFSFSVLADTLNNGIYILCNIANRTISANAGATETTANLVAFATLPADVALGSWNNVKATVTVTDIEVSINGTEVLRFSQSLSFYGSFGLGAALGHSAIFRNLSATSSTGDVIYSSPLNDESFLPDFLMSTNPLDASVDGSKRDRIAYAGDLDVAVSSSWVSTNGSKYIQGTLDLIGSYQLTPGFFAPTAKIQQKPLSSALDANITGLIGYSFSALLAAASFYQRSGNSTFAEAWAPKMVRMLNWAESQVMSETGLFNVSNLAFGGDWNCYDPDQAGLVAKFNMMYAYSLQSCLTLLTDAGFDTTPYISRLRALRSAINTNLWSDELEAYYVSESVIDGFGQDTNALAILAGVTNSNHTSFQVLSTMEQLSTPNGPLAFSNAV